MRQEVRAGNDNSVLVWASEIEDSTLRQAQMTARADWVSGPVALMPDAHLGFGSTVGSVIPSDGAICPSCIGTDIGCGMGAIELNRTVEDLEDARTRGCILDGIAKAIPAGAGKGLDGGSDAGWRWLEKDPIPVQLDGKVMRKALDQLGSLGSGNHFVEVCSDERGVVWAVLHSGSRGIGKAIADHFEAEAKQACRDHERVLEDPKLAYFLDSDPGYLAYIEAMSWAQRYAMANRVLMLNALERVLVEHLPGDEPLKVGRKVLCHHNYVAREYHHGAYKWITRKGAIRAQRGDLGIIPGSMATGSFIVEGLGNEASYKSASHGAGRRMSRGQARREVDRDEFAARMEGITWQDRDAEDLVDEAPQAYKDLGQVMEDQADLVRPLHRLECLINYKGVEQGGRRRRRKQQDESAVTSWPQTESLPKP